MGGVTIFLLRQVDDFAVATPSNNTVNKLFKLIQDQLRQPLLLLDTLTMFNGLGVTQGDKYIKLSCTIYITKILEGHN